MDHQIIEQDFNSVFSVLEAELGPLVSAELSVLVDILYQPEKLFRPGSDASMKCENCGFISRYDNFLNYCIKFRQTQLFPQDLIL